VRDYNSKMIVQNPVNYFHPESSHKLSELKRFLALLVCLLRGQNQPIKFVRASTPHAAEEADALTDLVETIFYETIVL
jgi:hypothetical protein